MRAKPYLFLCGNGILKYFKIEYWNRIFKSDKTKSRISGNLDANDV